MDSQKLTTQRLAHVVGSRRFQAFAVACLVLTALVFLQVNQLNQHQPMREIFTHCNLRANDIQRIEVALNQSGLNEFEIHDGHVLVPKTQQAAYLQAVSDHDAVPFELREHDTSNPALNPFLSRSQQQSIERTRKKDAICEMVIRLPFVDQAWFEMDQSNSHSVFDKAKQTAVISIQTNNNIAMTVPQSETVKRMIDGAVAGLELNDIEVIDLTTGAACQSSLDPLMNQLLPFQQVAVEQRLFYENRIRETLQNFPGLKVTVLVDLKPTSIDNQLALQPPSPTVVAVQPAAVIIGPGANGFASLNTNSSQPTPPVHPAETKKNNPASASFHKQISVTLEVPQSLVHDLFGPSPVHPQTASHLKNQPATQLPDLGTQSLQRNFNQLSSELIQKIRPLLPESTFQNRSSFPITVHLIRQPTPPATDWTERAKSLAGQHWPSAAVLVVGLVLFSIVSRQPANPTLARHRRNQEQARNAPLDESLTPGPLANPEVQLSNLIDQNPDAAAKVLESWIRDVA